MFLLVLVFCELIRMSIGTPANTYTVGVSEEFMRLIAWILVTILFSPQVSADNGERVLYQKLVDNANACSENVVSGQQRINCWVKAAPEKCESIVLDMFHDRKNMTKHRRKLYSCVASCVDPGFVSKIFGRCSSSL